MSAAANLPMGAASARLSAAKSLFQAHGASPWVANLQGLAALYGTLQQQESLLSFVDVFWMMGVLFLLTVPLVFVMRRPQRVHSDVPVH